MPGKINNYGLGDSGVNRVKSPIHLADGELRLAQNAVVSKIQGQHAVSKREGLAKLNAAAAAGAILALINIPMMDPSPGPPPASELPLEFLDMDSRNPVRWASDAWAKAADALTIFAGYDPTATGRDDTGYFLLSWEGGGVPDDDSKDGKVYRVVGNVSTHVATLPTRPGYTVRWINAMIPAVSNGYLLFRIEYLDAGVSRWDIALMRISDCAVFLAGDTFAAENDGSYPIDYPAPETVAVRLNDLGSPEVWLARTTILSNTEGVSAIRRRLLHTDGAITGAWTEDYRHDHKYQSGGAWVVVDSGRRIYLSFGVILETSGAAGQNRVLTSDDGFATYDEFTDPDTFRWVAYAEPGLLIDRNLGAYSVDNGETWTVFAPAGAAGSISYGNASVIQAFTRIGDDFWFYCGSSDDGAIPVYRMPAATMIPEHKGNLLSLFSTLCPLE